MLYTNPGKMKIENWNGNTVYISQKIVSSLDTYSCVNLVAADIEIILIKSYSEPQNHKSDVVAKYLVFQKTIKMNSIAFFNRA